MTVQNLENEKEALKIENSKLQLALAQARAKAAIYKKKIKSLKNYCKILEVNSFSSFSKTFINDQLTQDKPEFKSRNPGRRQTAQPVSNRSSDTEFDVSTKRIL